MVNPATQQVIAKVAECGAGETAAAIDAASNAQADWARRPAKDKALLLRRWFDAVMAHQEPLARLLTLEQGKSLVEARGEIAYGASYIEWFAEEAKRIYEDTIPAPGVDKRIITLKQPVGLLRALRPGIFPTRCWRAKLHQLWQRVAPWFASLRMRRRCRHLHWPILLSRPVFRMV